MLPLLETLPIETRLPPGFRTARTRLLGILPPITPRAPVKRTDASVDGVSSIVFLPDGTGLVAASLHGLQRWDFQSDSPRWRHHHYWTGSRRVALSPNGEHLVSAGEDHSVLLHELATGRPLRTLLRPAYFADTLAFAPDAGTLLWAGSEIPGNPAGLNIPKVSLWSVPEFELLWSACGEPWARTVASYESSAVVVMSESAGRRSFDARTGTALGFDASTEPRHALWPSEQLAEALLEPGLRVTAGPSARVELWTLSDASAPIDVIELPDSDLDRITALAVAPGEKSLALGTERGAVLRFAID
jgi:WD40 repeat protein